MCGSYHGATPFFAVQHNYRVGHGARHTRYTPFEERAEIIYEIFLRDRTGPRDLADPMARGPFRDRQSGREPHDHAAEEADAQR